jgi:hypothetical protein
MGTDKHLIEYSEIIHNDGAIDDAIADVKKLEKVTIAAAKNMKKAFSKTQPFDVKGVSALEEQVRELLKAQALLKKQLEALNKVKKEKKKLTDEELIQAQKLKLVQRERIARAKQQAIISREEKNNIASLRAQLSLVTLDWKKLTEAETTNTAAGRKLVKTKLDLTNQLKKLEKRTGDNRREVGNYGIALKRLNRIASGTGKTLKRLFIGRALVDGVLRLSAAFQGLVKDFKGSNSIIAGVGKSFDKITTTLQFAGIKILEFLAPAIELVANFFAKIPAVFAGVTAAGEQLFNTLGAGFNKLGLQVELIFANIEASNPFTTKSTKAIVANIKRIETAIEAQTNRQGNIFKAYKDAYDAVLKEQDEFVNKQAAKSRAAQRKQLADELAAIKAAEQRKIEIRLKAIIQLQLALENVEIANIKDREERLVRLEEQRFAAEQALRATNFSALEKMFEEAEEDTTEIKKVNDALKEEQEIKHQEALLQIARNYNEQKKALLDSQIAEIRDAAEEEQELADDFAEEKLSANQKEIQEFEAKRAEQRSKQLIKDKEAIKEREDAQKELLNNITKSAQKVGELIGELFQKQADLAGERVTDQETNLSNAEERQRQGLETNLAFEREQLAKRQSEQQAKQKEAENAAKILTLFNLVSAYAQSGDENALTRGLVDFAFLTAISAGFEEGGYTGDVGKKQVAGFVHGQEYVMTASDTKKYGLVGKSGGEFGEAMGDYFPTQTPTNTNPFPAQEEAFKKAVAPQQNSNAGLENEIKGLRKDLASQPHFSAQIVKVQKDLVGFILAENKQNMTTIKQEIVRAVKKGR